MSYYVTATNGKQSTKVLGPFRNHGEALRHEPRARRFCVLNVKDGVWAAYGTAHDRGAHTPGRLNDYLRAELDGDGFVVAVGQ